MPWEKNFDIDLALDEAMAMFWSRGYEATSMRDLVNCMGINRGSLYDTFASKRELFIAALRRYDERCRRARLHSLECEAGPVDSIRQLFEDSVQDLRRDPSHRGCFLTNTALEIAAHDTEIGTIVADSQRDTERFFLRRIEAGQATGEISGRLDSRGAARALLAALLGLLVLARSRPEPALARSIADNAIAMLRRR